ncbi:MAG: 16S rRNA (cytosine(1402)-N(4))-methyltransferase RsmH [Bryobacterales bacterium]|nr:16S rRNA (cytosine(1402)-N(4))-methyltransferase RsmH [Bryobacterales bacterium]
MTEPVRHVPVMTAEVLEYLAIRPGGLYVDATAGMGGHSGEIARRLQTGELISNDRDRESLALTEANTSEWASHIRYTQYEFSRLAKALEPGERADGLLADLGVSRYQLTEPSRGFSILADGPVDMRMDQTTGTTAGELVNFSDEKDLANLIYRLGEERRARRIARAIVRARPIRSTLHLAGVVAMTVPRTGRLHPATRTFMALRMAVNREQEELDSLLESGPGMLKPGGRMVVISFMSLEDRKVKERFRELERQGKGTILTKRPLQPSEAEINLNAASRSAKLRALEAA